MTDRLDFDTVGNGISRALLTGQNVDMQCSSVFDTNMPFLLFQQWDAQSVAQSSFMDHKQFMSISLIYFANKM